MLFGLKVGKQEQLLVLLERGDIRNALPVKK